MKIILLTESDIIHIGHFLYDLIKILLKIIVLVNQDEDKRAVNALYEMGKGRLVYSFMYLLRQICGSTFNM